MYFGWFDGIPAHLNPLPPVEEGKKYVEAIGGEDEVMKKAREAYNQGEYRWTATLLNHLVFANPKHKPARQLLADTYAQFPEPKSRNAIRFARYPNKWRKSGR